jgi:hypothetical protein
MHLSGAGQHKATRYVWKFCESAVEVLVTLACIPLCRKCIQCLSSSSCHEGKQCVEVSKLVIAAKPYVLRRHFHSHFHFHFLLHLLSFVRFRTWGLGVEDLGLGWSNLTSLFPDVVDRVACIHAAYRAVKAKEGKTSRRSSLDDFIVDSSEEDAFTSDGDSNTDGDFERESSDSVSSSAHAACHFEKQLIDDLRKKGTTFLV